MLLTDPMANTASSPAGFRHLVISTMMATLAFAGFYLLAYFVIPHPVTVGMGVICLLFVGGSLWVQYLLKRDHFEAAVSSFCFTILAGILAMAIVLPAIYPTLIVAVLFSVTLALMYTSGVLLRSLLIINTLAIAGVAVLCELVRLLPVLDSQLTAWIRLSTTITMASFLIWLLWQFSDRLRASLSEAEGANTRLRELQVSLESQVAERTVALREAFDTVREREGRLVETLTELQSSHAVIRELSVPVLPISDNILVMPLVGALDSVRL